MLSMVAKKQWLTVRRKTMKRLALIHLVLALFVLATLSPLLSSYTYMLAVNTLKLLCILATTPVLVLHWKTVMISLFFKDGRIMSYLSLILTLNLLEAWSGLAVYGPAHLRVSSTNLKWKLQKTLSDFNLSQTALRPGLMSAHQMVTSLFQRIFLVLMASSSCVSTYGFLIKERTLGVCQLLLLYTILIFRRWIC